MADSTYTYPPIQAQFFQTDGYKPLSIPWVSYFNRLSILSGNGAVLIGENIGTGGIGVYTGRLDTALQFKNIVALDSSISVTLSDNNIRIGANLPTVPPMATQAQMEADTSTDVTANPGVIKYSPGTAKAWVKFNSGGILAAYNVSSVTANGAGDYTINFTTSFSSADYCINVFTGNNSSVSGQALAHTTGAAPTASACRLIVGTVDTSGVLVPADALVMCAEFHGDF